MHWRKTRMFKHEQPGVFDRLNGVVPKQLDSASGLAAFVKSGGHAITFAGTMKSA